MRLVLASSSRTRAELLERAGLEFAVVSPNVDEAMLKESFLGQGAEPAEIADGLAEMKARKISAARSGSVVIGADQVLVFRGAVIDKSPNLPGARELLRRLSGQTHELISAVVLAKDGATVWRHLARAELSMRAFSDSFLDAYIASVGDEVLASVGCYRLEGRGAQLFSKVSGDYFTILGLPLLPLLSALRELGALET